MSKPECPECRSKNHQRYGFRQRAGKRHQAYRCKDCGRHWDMGKKIKAKRIWVAGESIPRCSCHSEPMYPRPGNRWVCIEKKRKWDREKYHTDPEWAERKREQGRKWNREKYHTDPEWAEQHRARYRLENMSPTQRLRNIATRGRYNRKLAEQRLSGRMAEKGMI